MATRSFWLELANASSIDWDAVAARLPFAAGMKACMQDPVFHAEGDVWTHTRMVVDALIAGRAARGERRSGCRLASAVPGSTPARYREARDARRRA